jgi:hypothetical protein
MGLALGVATTATRTAPGQAVRFQAGSGELGAQLDGQQVAPAQQPRNSTTLVREWLTVPLAGALFNPRTFSYTLTLRPVFQQVRRTGFDETLRYRQLDLDFGAQALTAAPVVFGVTGQRSSGTSDGGFGSRRDFRTSHLATNVWWRNRVFPTQFAFNARSGDDQWRNTVGGAPVRSAFTQRTYIVSASSSKLNVDARRIDSRDEVSATVYRASTAQGQHRLRWGKGSHLVSSLEYARQSGSLTRDFRAWSEQLYLQQTRSLGSDFFFRRSVNAAAGFRSQTDGFGAGLGAQIHRAVSAGLGVARYVARSPGTRQTQTALTPRLGVTLPLPLQARISLGGSLSLERNRRAGSSAITLAVVDERHDVPTSRSFTLVQPDVDLGSVVVRSLDGTVTYIDGADYVLNQAGVLVRVTVPPGSRIQTGSVVLVSYRYRPPPTGRVDATGFQYDLALGRPGIDLQHRRLRRQSGNGGGPRVGLEQLPADFDETRTTLALRMNSPVGGVSVDGTLLRQQRFRTLATERSVNVGYAAPTLGPATLALGAGWTRAATGPLELRSRALSATLHCTVAATVALSTRLDVSTWDQTESGHQRFVSSVVGIEWRPQALEVGGRYEYHVRELGTRHTTTRLALRVLRRL